MHAWALLLYFYNCLFNKIISLMLLSNISANKNVRMCEYYLKKKVQK